MDRRGILELLARTPIGRDDRKCHPHVGSKSGSQWILGGLRESGMDWRWSAWASYILGLFQNRWGLASQNAGQRIDVGVFPDRRDLKSYGSVILQSARSYLAVFYNSDHYAAS